MKEHSGLGVSATVIDVDLTKLLGTSSGGRLYTFGGEIYYFDSAFISELDTLIRCYSLTGARVYIRLLCTDPGLSAGDMEEDKVSKSAHYYALRADDERSFGILYSAVDFLTSRYRSSEYGYVAGVIAGADASDTVSKNSPGTNVSPVEYAKLLEGAMRLIYEVGCANISNFEVYLPMGPVLCAGSGIDGGSMTRRTSFEQCLLSLKKAERLTIACSGNRRSHHQENTAALLCMSGPIMNFLPIITVSSKIRGFRRQAV